MDLVYTKVVPDRHPRALSVKPGEWRRHPDGMVVPRLSPFFIWQLNADQKIRDHLEPDPSSNGSSGSYIIRYKNGVFGKVCPMPYAEFGAKYLAEGFGYAVPYFGYMDSRKNDGNIVLLTSAIDGFDLKCLIGKCGMEIPSTTRQELWGLYGNIEGKFWSKGIDPHYLANENQPKNYIWGIDSRDLLGLREAGAGPVRTIHMIDVDYSQGRIYNEQEVNSELLMASLKTRVERIGLHMEEPDYIMYVQGVISGFFNVPLDMSDRLIQKTVAKLKDVWKGSGEYISKLNALASSAVDWAAM